MLYGLTGHNVRMPQTEQKPQFPQKLVGRKAFMVEPLKGNQTAVLSRDGAEDLTELSLSNQTEKSIV
jgi:hypothetical protein